MQQKTKIFDDIASLKTMPDGEVFDAEDVWNKLEDKINKKKKRKASWIWLAASTLILISISTFFKINHSNNIVDQTANKVEKNNQLQNVVVDVHNKIKYSNNIVDQATNNGNNTKKKTSSKTTIFIADNSIVAIEIPETIVIDSTPILKAENKNIAILKPIRKRLKIVYASDFADENDIEKYQQQEKNSTARGIFKMFETSTNKQTEEATTTENNQPQPNKTLLFFKAKPAATISINENY